MNEIKIKTKKYITNNQTEIVVYILLGLLTYLLSTHFSKDWYSYQHYFDKKIIAVDWLSFLSQITVFREPLYLIPAKFFGQLFGFSRFILITTIVLLVLKLTYFKKVTQINYTVSAFFYICFYLFLFEGTQLRVAYATSFVIVAFYLLQREKFILSFLMIILASQVHLTALIFLIALPLYFFRSFNVVVNILAVTSPLFILLDISLFGLFKSVLLNFNPKYIYYFEGKTRLDQNSTGLYFYFIAFIALLLGSVCFYLKDMIKHNQFVQTIFSTALFGFVAMCVFHDFVAVGARLGELLLVTTVILLSYLYQYFYSHKMKIEQIVLISISLIYFSARLLYIYPDIFSLHFL